MKRPDFLAHARFVREVASEIEAIRVKRQTAWRAGDHPEGKRFTQEELTNEVYGSYKNMLLGRTRRIPTRDDLLHIAEYLETTIDETNDLLLVARYLPESVNLRSDQAHALLQQATTLIHSIPFPAVVMQRGWITYTANMPYLSAFGIPHIERISLERRTSVHAHFDPMHPGFLANSFDDRVWETNARGTLRLLFQHVDPLLRREAWYRSAIGQFHTLTGFTRLYNESLSQAGVTAPVMTFADQTIRDVYRVQITHLSLHRNGFPMIHIGIPADAAARHLFGQAEPVTLENRWEQAVAFDTAELRPSPIGSRSTTPQSATDG